MDDRPPLLGAIGWASPFLPAPTPLQGADRVRLERAAGFVPSYAATIAAVAWVFESVVRMGPPQQAHLSYALGDLVALVVCQDNSCRDCYGAARTQLQLTGSSEDTIRELELNLHRATLPDRDRRVLELSRKLSRSNPRPGVDDCAPARSARVSHGELLEAAIVAALNVYWTRLFTGIAAEPDAIEQLPRHRFGPLGRVFVGWTMRRRRHVPPVPMPQEAKAGLFGRNFAALDGIPSGATLSRIVDDALRSSIE